MSTPIQPFARRPLDGTPYVLTGLLGEGCMGYVFAAEHAELGRPAAVKVLGTRVSYNDNAMERLRREARALATLQNPHIVDVYDLGFTADSQPYIAMGLVAGTDLGTLLELDGIQPTERVVALAEQVAAGLEAVHGRGLVHCDLKPSNLMVEQRDGADHVTILDFGIAAVLDEDPFSMGDEPAMGTPGYIAPEQALGNAVDGRADQYSLAMVVYQLLAGHIAHPGHDGLDLVTAQLTLPPKAFDEALALPAGLQRVIMRALSRDPDARYPSIRAFADALRAGLTAPAAGGGSRWLPYAIAAGIGVISVGVYLAAPWQSRDAAPGSIAPLERALATMTPAPVAPRSAATVASAKEAATAPETAAAPASAMPPSAAPASVADAAPESLAPASQAPASLAAARPARQARARRTTDVRRRAKTRPKPTQRPERRSAARAPASAAPETAAPTPAAPETAGPTPAAPETTAPTSVARVVPETAAPATAAPATAAPATAPPPPPPGRLAIGEPEVKGGVSVRNIRKALRSTYAGLRRCVADLDKRPVGARASVRFVIDSDGFFGGVQSDGHAALAQCGTRAIRRAGRLRHRPDTGRIQVRLPLRLEAP